MAAEAGNRQQDRYHFVRQRGANAVRKGVDDVGESAIHWQRDVPSICSRLPPQLAHSRYAVYMRQQNGVWQRSGRQ